MNKLNIGCGRFYKDGYLNVDIDPASRADVVHDLESLPYPFESEAYDEITMDHVLEHLSQPFAVVKELHRLVRPDGSIVIRVPHFSRGFTHPDHKRGFDISFPYYFRPDFEGYTGTALALRSMRLRWFAQPYLKARLLPRPLYLSLTVLGAIIDSLANLSPGLCSRLWCFWVGGFEEIEFVFVKGHDGRRD